MQKTIIAIIVVVLIAGVGVWAFTQTDQDAQQQNTGQQAENQFSETSENGDTQTAETAEVTYTDDGFSPETTTVEAGTTVTWVNESDGQMWVASSVHPTHNELPEFDQRNGVETGGEFSFQFDETGEWGYHNHLNPSDKGTVVVE